MAAWARQTVRIKIRTKRTPQVQVLKSPETKSIKCPVCNGTGKVVVRQ